MDLSPLRPGDSLTKLQGTVPELMLLGPTRGVLSWAPAGAGEESASASPRGLIVFPVAGALLDGAPAGGLRQEPSCRHPLLRVCRPPSEGDPKSCLCHHKLYSTFLFFTLPWTSIARSGLALPSVVSIAWKQHLSFPKVFQHGQEFHRGLSRSASAPTKNS